MMRLKPITKGTAWLSLFYCLMLAACAATPPPPVFPSRILWKDDYSVKAGESAEMRLFKIAEDGSEKRITFSRSGPMRHDCSGGCGSLSAQVNANPGMYRIEANNAVRPGVASTTFTVLDNEFWIWIITDADKTPSFTPISGSNVTGIKRGGAYRIDPLGVGIVDMMKGIDLTSPRETVPAHLPQGHPESRMN